MAVKLTPKGPLPPFGCIKTRKKKKKAICKAFLGCFSRVFKLFLDTRKNRAFKALLNCPGRLDNGTKQTYISNCRLAVKQKAKRYTPEGPAPSGDFLIAQHIKCVYSPVSAWVIRYIKIIYCRKSKRKNFYTI